MNCEMLFFARNLGNGSLSLMRKRVYLVTFLEVSEQSVIYRKFYWMTINNFTDLWKPGIDIRLLWMSIVHSHKSRKTLSGLLAPVLLQAEARLHPNAVLRSFTTALCKFVMYKSTVCWCCNNMFQQVVQWVVGCPKNWINQRSLILFKGKCKLFKTYVIFLNIWTLY